MPAGGKKKKTKAAANPARGFATTSVPKSVKADTPTASDGEAHAPNAVRTPETAPTSIDSRDRTPVDSIKAETSLHGLSPEELEAQLERSELQQFVEKHGSKIRKDVARQVARLTTDRRVLRGQSDFLSVKPWLPDELMQQILDLAFSEPISEPQGKTSVPRLTPDDLLSKIWSLRTCLVDLGFSTEIVNELLAKLLANNPPSDALGGMWGLTEVLDLFASNSQPGHHLDYDYQRPQEQVTKMEEESSSALAAPTSEDRRHDTMSQEVDGIDVSDLDSDLEPDDLMETYLREKAKLFRHAPEALDAASSRGKGRKRNPEPSVSKSAGHRKLESKLRKIESDLLFDQDQADAKWSVLRIDLERESAERRKLQLAESEANTKDKGATVSEFVTCPISEQAERLGQALLDDAEDDLAIGGMFDALPGVTDSEPTAAGEAEASVIIRDFGKLTGLNPKRVLEEACKARDQAVKITYKLISPTTYASRSQVTVRWSKDVEPVESGYLTAFKTDNKGRVVEISSVMIATPDTAQSEAMIATVGLFIIFSGSPKEEKAHLRLPSAYRDFWDEMSLAKREHLEQEDITTVKELRDLVDRSQAEQGEDDDNEVVFNAGSRNRSKAASGLSTPAHEREEVRKYEVSQELIDLWSRKSSSTAFRKMLAVRTSLPIFHFKSKILESIDRSRVLILVSETGSGKSTQLPSYIVEHELSQGRRCKVYCTQPRRISAISLAHRVSEELGEARGDVGTFRSLVGYAIRLESHTSTSTRLVYATTGIVLRMLESDKNDGLGDITHLVVDEVHERSIDSDFLLIMLRSLLQRHPDLKVILMSATVNAQRFSEYLDGAPIIDVPGRTFPVQAKFLEDAIEISGYTANDASIQEDDGEDGSSPSEGEAAASKGLPLSEYSARTRSILANYNEYGVDFGLIVKLLQKLAFDGQWQHYSKAVLIFLPGIAEIRTLNDILTSHPSFSKSWRIYPLHSSFSSEDQQAAFDVPPDNVRKIVLATNIAETGITIPDVTAVIDTGKHKEMRYDEKRQMSRLIMAFIARANAKQRRGRAGRVQEGVCFHLFTKQRHDEFMAESQTPEMLRLSLQELCLRVKISGMGDIEYALSQALDPPSSRNIRRAIDALIEVGALRQDTEELTPLGVQIAKLPLDAQLGKLTLLASCWGCLDFALTAAATLTSKSPFLSPMHAKKQADTVRMGFKMGDSDLMTAYNAYIAWRKVCETPNMNEYQFCNKNFLSPQNLANIEDLKGQLLTSLVDAGFVTLDSSDKHTRGGRNRKFVTIPAKYCVADTNETTMAAVVAWSFYPKIIKREGKGWRNIANNQSLALHPASVNKQTLPPEVKLLSFYSILQSSSKYTNAQETTPAPEVALVLLAGDAVFHMYAGVIVIDGNRLRYKVRDWKTMIVLKTLRSKLKEVMARMLRFPGQELKGRQALWFDIARKMLELQQSRQ